MENCIEVNGNDREVHRSVMEELERVCGEKDVKIIKCVNKLSRNIIFIERLKVIYLSTHYTLPQLKYYIKRINET